MIFRSNPYYQDINYANDFLFSMKEIDIITGIVAGLRNKEIAFLLDIEVVTLSKHVGNILKKINGSSKWDIVELARKSGKYDLFIHYYNNNMNKERDFRKEILNIRREVNFRKYNILLIKRKGGVHNHLIKTIKTYFTLAGIRTYERDYKEDLFCEYDSLENKLTDMRYINVCFDINSTQATNNPSDNTIYVQLNRPLFKTSSEKQEIICHDSLESQNRTEACSVPHVPSFGNLYQEINCTADNKTSDIFIKIIRLMLSRDENTCNRIELFHLIDSINHNNSHDHYHAEIYDTHFNKKHYLMGDSANIDFHRSQHCFIFRCPRMHYVYCLIHIILSSFCIWAYCIYENDQKDELVTNIEVSYSCNTQNKNRYKDFVSKIEKKHDSSIFYMDIDKKITQEIIYYLMKKDRFTIKWKISAQTPSSIIESFIDLLKKTNDNIEQIKEINRINLIKDNYDKMLEVVWLLQPVLKKNKWFFIYENSENLEELKDFYPFDPVIWGSGTLIIIPSKIKGCPTQERVVCINKALLQELT